MHIFAKKACLSILASILVLVTMVVTTYAWVGMLTYSSVNNFEVNLEPSTNQEYGIEYSLDGINFSDHIDTVDFKKAILVNMGYNASILDTAAQVNSIFNSVRLRPSTTFIDSNKELSQFRLLDGSVANKDYYKFDIYLSAVHNFDGANPADSNYTIDIYLTNLENTLKGDTVTSKLINPFTYPSSVNYTNPFAVSANHVVSDDVKVNIASSTRMAISKYEVVEKGKPELYTTTNPSVQSTTIFQGGTQDPTLKNGVYSFGGILPKNENVAYTEYSYTKTIPEIPTNILNRNDLELIEGNNLLVDESEGVGITTMIKVSVYFWFEGWDSDCFEIISKGYSEMNLSFSTLNI